MYIVTESIITSLRCKWHLPCSEELTDIPSNKIRVVYIKKGNCEPETGLVSEDLYLILACVVDGIWDNH